MSSSKFVLYLLVAAGIGYLIWIIWFKKKANTLPEIISKKGADVVSEKSDISSDISGNENSVSVCESIAYESESAVSGQTLLNVDSRTVRDNNGRYVKIEQYYLSFVCDGEGCSGNDIESISGRMCQLFIKNYPTGIAQGNVIKKYCSE